MKIRLTDAARQDIADGHAFYESQAQGIGKYFLVSVIESIQTLASTAGMHSVHFQKYHRLLLKRFPFAVYYTIHDSTVDIHAVLDCRRNPVHAKNKFTD